MKHVGSKFMSQTVSQKSKKKPLYSSKEKITRGAKLVRELLAVTQTGQKWFNGPQFLRNDEESKGSVHLEPLPETHYAIKTSDYLVASLTTEELDLSKYEDWNKLCSILAYDSTPTERKF